MKQYSLFDECFVDSFAGGGGASTGIEMATGHPVDIAINHNEAAIMMHQKNHPFTEHYIEDVWAVDPKKAVRGRHVRLAWFSPDCKHFSRAKGAALVDKKIRGLAWVVLKWAAAVRPDVIMLENVPEFVTWGPVRKGKPVKKKAGQTYEKWLSQLKALGYEVETNKLCAADFGAPTIRTRFHLIARCDGRPIVFPERTHKPRDSDEVKSGKCKPWRSAAEVIQWDLPCPSIFESKEKIKEQYGLSVKRPLKPNTLCRVARGLDKFVIKSAEPFIVPIGYGENKNQKPRVHDIKEPLSTVVSSTKQYVCDPLLSPYIMSNNTGNVCHGMDEPVPTVTTGDRNFLIAPHLIQYHSELSKSEVRGQRVDAALNTVDGSNRYGLSTAYLVQYFSGEGHYHSVEKPLATITTMEREGITVAHLAHFKGKDKGQHPLDPLMTVTARDGQFADIRTCLVKWDGRTDLGYWSEVRKLLNTYCDYDIKDDEILLINIRGIWYYISDIGLRMLIPRELYDAMGFPHDYIIDRDIKGNAITRTDQVARCGNAVCPAVAEALVRANLPECCKVKINDMDQLHNVMTS
jgi:DNA (cytosine-5)-methyltransferase 1